MNYTKKGNGMVNQKRERGFCYVFSSVKNDKQLELYVTIESKVGIDGSNYWKH